MDPLGGRSQDHGSAASSEGRQGGAVKSEPDLGVGLCLPSDFWPVAVPSSHRLSHLWGKAWTSLACSLESPVFWGRQWRGCPRPRTLLPLEQLHMPIWSWAPGRRF